MLCVITYLLCLLFELALHHHLVPAREDAYGRSSLRCETNRVIVILLGFVVVIADVLSTSGLVHGDIGVIRHDARHLESDEESSTTAHSEDRISLKTEREKKEAAADEERTETEEEDNNDNSECTASVECQASKKGSRIERQIESPQCAQVSASECCVLTAESESQFLAN